MSLLLCGEEDTQRSQQQGNRLGPEAAPSAGDSSPQPFQGAGNAQTIWFQYWTSTLSRLPNLLTPQDLSVYLLLGLEGCERFQIYEI